MEYMIIMRFVNITNLGNIQIKLRLLKIFINRNVIFR